MNKVDFIEKYLGCKLTSYQKCLLEISDTYDYFIHMPRHYGRRAVNKELIQAIMKHKQNER